MNTSEIKAILMKALMLNEAYVSGSSSHFQVIVISEQFAGMSSVKKQQVVYAPLMKYILSNCIHALSIKAYTPDEWRRESKSNSFTYYKNMNPDITL